MDSEEKIGFLLTPKVQELIMQIAEDLEADGIKVDNYVFSKILQELAKHGKILQLNGQEIKETIEKIVPPGGKVLNMSSQILICQECGKVIEESTAVKVQGEGFVCNECCDRWITGDDDDETIH